MNQKSQSTATKVTTFTSTSIENITIKFGVRSDYCYDDVAHKYCLICNGQLVILQFPENIQFETRHKEICKQRYL